MQSKEISIPVNDTISLRGNLNIPSDATSLVIFSHGSGSSRLSPRNMHVANILNEIKIATLLTDLLTEKEDEIYNNRFDIDRITERLIIVTKYVVQMPETKNLKVGYFGASTGAAAALKAAAQLHNIIQAVVSRGGRPDLAMESLGQVKSPTLLIVGSHDGAVIELNQQAYHALSSEKKLIVVKGAGHLFEESGKLDEVARLATDWFIKYLHPTFIVKPVD